MTSEYDKCLTYFSEGKNALDENKVNTALNYFLKIIKNKDAVYNYTDSTIDILIYNDILSISTKSVSILLKTCLNNQIEYIKCLPDVFDYIGNGDIKGFIKNFNKHFYNFNIYKNGITPLHSAIYNGDTNFLKYLLIIKGDIDIYDNNHNTLLEFACIQNDPNVIDFLVKHGANIKKHIILRQYKKCVYRSTEIDIALVELYLINSYLILYGLDEYIENEKYKYVYLEWIYEYIPKKDILDVNYKNVDTNQALIIIIDELLSTLGRSATDEFIKIIKEELQYNLLCDLCCPNNKLHIVLYNIIPFIRYTIDLSLNWIIHQDFKNILLSTNFVDKDIKKEFKHIVYNKYINSNILTKDRLKMLMHQQFYKLNI